MKVKLTSFYGEAIPGHIIETDEAEGKRIIAVGGGVATTDEPTEAQKTAEQEAADKAEAEAKVKAEDEAAAKAAAAQADTDKKLAAAQGKK